MNNINNPSINEGLTVPSNQLCNFCGWLFRPITSLQGKVHYKNIKSNFLTKTNRFAKLNCHLRGFKSDFCMHQMILMNEKIIFVNNFKIDILNVVLFKYLTQKFWDTLWMFTHTKTVTIKHQKISSQNRAWAVSAFSM